MRPTWIAAIVVVVIAAGIAAYSVEGIGSAASSSGVSTSNENSSSLGSSVSGSPNSSTVSATSQTSTSSTVSRVADIQSAYTADVTPSSSSTTLTGTNSTSSICPPSGRDTMELQVVSDTTGMPVQQGAAAVGAVYENGCAGIEFHETNTLYFDRIISQGSSGWFDLPYSLGGFNFTVGYAGRTYSFPGSTYPDSTTCVTLAVPSGAVTLTRYQFSNYDCAGDLGGWAGQPTYGCFGEVYLRVLPDSGSAPVAGANVTTAYDFAQTCYLDPTPCQNPSICGEAFKNFTTTSTEWYAFGDSTDSFNVTYGGQTFVVTASQRAASTCETLHVPSGAVDTTYGPGCVAGAPSTSTSTTVNLPTCVGPANTLLNPAQKGTVYMKVVTDQGTVITNGTLNVTQSGKLTDGERGDTNGYCISMGDVNGTGYLQLALINKTLPGDGFIASGYYNVTLVAGYNHGPWYLATIPSIQVHPNSTIYVTVSVPSGVVTVTTSNEGSSAATTTTTSATTIPSTTNDQYDCGVGFWLYKLGPVQNGSLYLRLVTSQGVPITNNGTVFILHTAPSGGGYYGGSGEYCVALKGNATGYAGLTADDGLQGIGSYGLTIFAGYGQGSVYQVTIPPITVPPDTTVSVTVVVPSGEVTVVSCTQGSRCTTATFVAVRG
jgi:hypothetical protein